jgi:hypothetical protein
MHAQDPGTVIDIKLMRGDSLVAGKELKNYSITAGRVLNDCVITRQAFENTYQDSAQFRYFSWDPYDSLEIYEVDIVNGADTMKVRFCGYEERWNAYFFLEVPFSIGYYEVTDFRKIKGYFYEGKREWAEVAPAERKLTGIMH